MKFLPNMLGFLGPLGYHPPEKDGDFNIIQDVQSRPLTYSVIPMSVMTHHQINYWTCKNPNFYHRNHFARGGLFYGAWRYLSRPMMVNFVTMILPLVDVALFNEANYLIKDWLLSFGWSRRLMLSTTLPYLGDICVPVLENPNFNWNRQVCSKELTRFQFSESIRRGYATIEISNCGVSQFIVRIEFYLSEMKRETSELALFIKKDDKWSCKSY